MNHNPNRYFSARELRTVFTEHEFLIVFFEHESLESNESFILKQLIRLIRLIRVQKKQ